MKIINLYGDATKKDKFSNVDVQRTKVSQNFMFGITNVCEQMFSVIMVNKSKLCSQHTDAHLDALLKVAQSLIPHYDAVVQIKIRQAPLLVPIIHLLMF